MAQRVITTSTGFKCRLNEDALDDMRLVEQMGVLSNGSASEQLVAVSSILNSILGEEQKEKLYKHVEEKGRVSVSKVMNELSDIFNGVTASKKK